MKKKRVDIKFIKDGVGFNKGKVVETTQEEAEVIIEEGYAEYIKEEEKPIEEKQEEWIEKAHTRMEEEKERRKKLEDERRRLSGLKLELQELISLDEIDKEQRLEELSEESKINISVLRKQLNKYIQNFKNDNKYNQEKEVVQEIYTKEQYKEAIENFKREDLLELIKKEISKKHIGDDNLKMTGFITATSGLLKEPKLRKSIAYTGDSSLGKDNAIKSILFQMPRDSFIFLTNATQSIIEDDIKDKRIIAFSEMNVNREAGANKYLVEVIKQKAEGGTSSGKKDIRTGMKTARFEVGEQGSVLYGTTESEKGEELQTRFITGSILVEEERIKKVNKNTLETFSEIDKLIEDSTEQDNWVRIGLTYFFNKEKQFVILIPYAALLDGEIEGKSIYDNSNPRSQRDLKRLLALTSAVTYLFQEQRKIIEYNGYNILISEPEDFINTLTYSKEFFNQSYTGLDLRLSKVLEYIQENKGAWVDKKLVQDKLRIKTRATINHYCSVLADEGFIEGCKGVQLNLENSVKLYDGNRIYYRSVQKAYNKPFISVQLGKLKEYIENNYKLDIEHLMNKSVQNKAFNLTSEPEVKETEEKTPISEDFSEDLNEIERFKMNASNKIRKKFNWKDFKKAGYSNEEIIDLLEEQRRLNDEN